MRILIVGAGVIGSFNALRLCRAGHDVDLLARGARLESLRARGVQLEDFRTGQCDVEFVPVVDHVDAARGYELTLVVVRRNQVASVLPLLAGQPALSTCLFLGNNAAGSTEMVEALGQERVVLGMVNAGGAFDGDVIRYVWTRRLSLLFGEVDGHTRPRDAAISAAFAQAGLPARNVRDVEAYQKTHAAGLPAFAGALYSAGGDIGALAHRPALIRRWLAAYQEAQRALRSDGTAIRPAASWAINVVPGRLIAPAVARFLDTRLAVVGGQAHANAAPDEMKELADELRVIFDRTGVPHPASDILFEAVDVKAAAPRPI